MPAHAGRGIADYFFLMQPKWIWIKGIILSNLGTMSVHLSIKFPKHFLNLLMPVRIHHLISFDWHLLCVGENGVPSIFIISFYYIRLYRFLFQEGALLIFSLLPSFLGYLNNFFPKPEIFTFFLGLLLVHCSYAQ